MRFFAFSDDDCVTSSNWLNTLAGAFLDAHDCAVGGKTINSLTENPFSTGSRLPLDYSYEYYNQDFQGATFLASNNLAFPRKAFLERGGVR